MKLRYIFRLEGQLLVEADSKDSACRLAYEALADIKLGTRKNLISLEGMRIKKGEK